MHKRLLIALLALILSLPICQAQTVPSGNVSIPTDVIIPPNPIIPGTKGMVVPNGSTVQRPSPPRNGTVRVNNTTGKLEWYSTLLGWQDAGGGGGSGNGDEMSISSFVAAGTAGVGFNFCNAAGGGFTLTLPTAVGNAGKIVEVKKTDITGNVVTVDGSGGETVDGALTYTLTTAYQTVSLISDGTSWFIK